MRTQRRARTKDGPSSEQLRHGLSESRLCRAEKRTKTKKAGFLKLNLDESVVMNRQTAGLTAGGRPSEVGAELRMRPVLLE